MTTWRERQLLGVTVMVAGGLTGAFCLAAAAAVYVCLEWKRILYWLIYWSLILAMAFMIAVALVAVFQPMYDLTHWRIQ
jgi:hypothetical protein